MKIARFGLLAALLLSASSASFAIKTMHALPAPIAPTMARVEAAPFQLQQVSTRAIGDVASQSLYRGKTTLTVTPADPAATASTIDVQVELRTLTALNKAGDGMTDGWVVLYSPDTRQSISGPLSAVNRNFGELTGLIEGRSFVKGAPTRLRAIFQGTFVPDATGAYTLVNVEARGVLSSRPTGNPGPEDTDD